MRLVVYQKQTLQIVGTLASNETVEETIEKDVIPNYGGVIEDYDYIEVAFNYFKLDLVDGEVVAIEIPPPPPEPQPPTDTEILMDYVVNVDYRVTALELGII